MSPTSPSFNAPGTVGPRLRTILNAFPGLVGYVDDTLRYRFTSDSYREFFGGENFAGRSVESVVGPEIFATTGPLYDRILKGERISLTSRLNYPLKGEQDMHIDYIPDVDGDVVRGFFVFAYEMGDRLKAEEELRRSNKELEQFAFVASHDLKEPLRKIAGYAELLHSRYKDKLDDKAVRYLDYLQDGVRRMDTIIQDLLMYSRAGRGKAVREPVDTAAVARETLGDLEAAIRDSAAQISVGDLPTVSGNRTQIAQVFQNLIGNAIKFRRGPGPKVEVSARREGNVWAFAVADDGIGIDPQYFERVFEIFQRLHTRSEYPGTGIGLAIVKKIIETHGGRIWVESAPGHGAAFRFTLPAS